MIEITFTGNTLADLRKQIAGFLADKPTVSDIVPLTDQLAPKAYAAEIAGSDDPQPQAVSSAVVQHVDTAVTTVDTTAETVDASTPVADVVYTYADVSLGMLKLSRKTNRDTVLAFLARFGAKANAKELDPARYPEVMAALDLELA